MVNFNLLFHFNFYFYKFSLVLFVIKIFNFILTLIIGPIGCKSQDKTSDGHRWRSPGLTSTANRIDQSIQCIDKDLNWLRVQFRQRLTPSDPFHSLRGRSYASGMTSTQAHNPSKPLPASTGGLLVRQREDLVHCHSAISLRRGESREARQVLARRCPPALRVEQHMKKGCDGLKT